MLEAAIYYLLKKHFRQESYYVDLLELFHEVGLLALASSRMPRAAAAQRATGTS